MDCIATRLPYRQTNAFSKIALDYIDQLPALANFYEHPVNMSGVRNAIAARKNFPTDRNNLVEVLEKQYEGIQTSEQTKRNIQSLLSPDTFVITTAHQNNIFTGQLYFIYKILHTIKLAGKLKASLPEFNFVPVFYIGTEDADFEELNHIHLGDEKLEWQSGQTGAVGAMAIDKNLVTLREQIAGQLRVLPFGEKLIAILEECYSENKTISQATLEFVNALMGSYGLVVLKPEHASLKRTMISLFREELLNQSSSPLVEETAGRLDEAGYKVQASPREINLFYLRDGIRERIEKDGSRYKVVHTSFSFSEEEILRELETNPERFSPNVILRGIYQETILPGISFIGGGGEIAYWLQLKSLFEFHHVPYPMLVLRNSFLFIDKKWQEKARKLGFTTDDLFLDEQELLGKLVARESKNETRLNGSLQQMEALYSAFKKQAAAVDGTLEKHVEALRERTVQRLVELEKKMLRAEKRKFSDQQRQISTLKNHLFPGNGLQERVENIMYYYACYGPAFIQKLLDESPALEQEFTVITCNDAVQNTQA